MQTTLQKVLVVLLVLPLVTCRTGADKGPPPLSMAQFDPAYEDTFTAPGSWTELNGGLENTIDPAIPPEDIRAAKDGAGVSLALLRDFNDRDCEIVCHAVITAGAAAGVVFRATENEGAVTSMFCLAISISGATLWRYEGKRWIPVYQLGGLMAERTPHLLEVRAKGEEIEMTVNGVKLPPFRDTTEGGGRIGILGREGYTRFNAFEADDL